MSTLLSFCQWLAETPFSTGIRESTYIYPIIESVHVLSLCIFVGLLLFASDPVRFFGNIFFRIKAFGLFLALLNAMAFHLGIERRLVDWDTAAVTPRAAKLAGAISIGLWAVIVVTGRFVAYNWFSPLV